MLTKVQVENFQSLHHVELELAPLTVIVGRSSSGKSALTRALRTLTSNARGDSFITHGEQTATITAHTDKGIVSLSRGKRNEYSIFPTNGQKKNFTKLAGGVPEEVTEFIGIPAKDPLNYSSQFDMPYLLTSSAAEVARTLGELTNVHIIFEAAREANRQRLTHSQTLKTRVGDLQALEDEIQQYDSLPLQRDALTLAQDTLNHVQRQDTLATRLQGHIMAAVTARERLEILPPPAEIPDLSRLGTALGKLRRIQALIALAHGAAARLQEIPAQRDIPSISSLQAANKKLTRLQGLISDALTNQGRVVGSQLALSDASAALQSYQESHHHTLQQAGTCPTCRQSTKDIPWPSASA